MIGAIAGDIIGSVYEWNNIKTKEFPLFSEGSSFTDDTVLTIALADSILSGEPYLLNLKKYYLLYPGRGYGSSFGAWASSDNNEPYHSWGNGAAMRISPAGYAFDSLETVLSKSREFTEITHNHPEGIKGAQATASAIFLAKTGKTKKEIRQYIENAFHYDLGRDLDEIRMFNTFNESCQGTVPEALCAFLESTDFEDAIRNAISLGGDSDTLSCITGGIAEAFYGGVPDLIKKKVFSILDEPLGSVVHRFEKEYLKCPQ